MDGAREIAISVIVPHLNQPEALDGLLAALRQQEAAPAFELIIADNGSRHPVDARLQQLADVRVVVERKPGPGHARSAGAAAARGKILAFTDADGRPAPGWLAAIAAHFADPAAAPAIAGEIRIAADDPARPNAIEAYESIWGYRQKLYVERDGYAATCNFAVRAEVYQKVGPFAGLEVAEDRDWGRRATLMGVRHAYLPQAVVTTPARSSFADLARKWDRHIAHDWAETGRGLPARLSWLGKAAALPLSPLAEIARIARTDRVAGTRARLLAFVTLVRIRTHRAVRMLQLACGASPERLLEGWRPQAQHTAIRNRPCALS